MQHYFTVLFIPLFVYLFIYLVSVCTLAIVLYHRSVMIILNIDKKKPEKNDIGEKPLDFFQGRSMKVKKRTKIRFQYNQAPHLTQDTNGKSMNTDLILTFGLRN